MKTTYFKTNPSDKSLAISLSSLGDIQNLGEEMIKGIEEQLNRLRFISTKISLLGNTGVSPSISNESDKEILNDYLKLINRKAKIQAFTNAYLSAAANEKKAGINEIKQTSFENWVQLMKDQNRFLEKIETYIDKKPKDLISLTDYRDKKKEELGLTRPCRPDEPKEITAGTIKNWELDYLGLDIKDLSEYYYYLTLASVIGKTIHNESGPVKKAIDNYNSIILSGNTFDTTGTGRDTIIREYSSEYTQEEVNGLLSLIHGSHRDAQKVVNSFIYKAKCVIENLNIQRREDYNEKLKNYEEELETYNKKIQEIDYEYQEKVRLPHLELERIWSDTEAFLKNQYRSWQLQEEKNISQYKIIIPNLFLDIYQEISNAMKKKD